MPKRSNQFSPQRFLKKVLHTIDAFHLLKDRDSVLIAVSGGPDSIALLHALVGISKKYQIKLGVAHLNHGLRRKDSDADAEFVLSVAHNWGLPCFVEKKNILHEHKQKRMSIEEAGREARYDFFNKVADTEGFDKIAVGHHADDNAELILINLLRGSGPLGLKGISPVRGKIIRPLIRVSRESILSYLKYYQLSYRTDSSNSDEQFLRNKIRHQLIPLLKSQYNPNISESLNRLGNIIYADEDWLTLNARSAMEESKLCRDNDAIVLSVEKLLQFHIAVQKRVIRQAIFHAKGDLRRITYAHIDATVGLVKNNLESLRLDLPDRIRIQKHESQLVISKERKSLRSIELSEKNAYLGCFEYTLFESDVLGDPVIIKEINVNIRFLKLKSKDVLHMNSFPPNISFFDWDRLTFPLVVRNFRAGDRFTPLGMTGTQSLKKFFINNKICKSKRACTPIIFSGNNIIWVGGERISDQFKVTSETKTILCAEIFSR